LCEDPTSLLCNNHLCLLLMGMKVIPSLIVPLHNIKGIDPCKKYSMNWWILDVHQFDKLLGGVIMIFLLFDLGTRDGTNDCKYIHCPKNFMNDIWSLVSWWGGCGEGYDLDIFGGLIASYLLNNVQSAVHNVFPICSWCTFFPYALPNVHLFCSHSSHVLSHFLCPIFLMLFLKFPWFPIMFPISNNLCWKSYYSLDNWAKMERRVCKLYFRCVQTLEISFLRGCKLGNMFFVVGQSTRPITRRRFQSWDSRTVIILSHGPSHPHKVAWYFKVIATFVKPFGVCESSRWLFWRKKLVEVDMNFFLHVYPMFTPLTSMQKASTCTLFLLHYNKSFALLLFQLYVIGVRSISMHGVYKWPTHWGS
jgi:hypothetical protein